MVLSPDFFYESHYGAYTANYTDDTLFVTRYDKKTRNATLWYLDAKRQLSPVRAKFNLVNSKPVDLDDAGTRLNYLLLFDPYTPFFSKHQFSFYAGFMNTPSGRALTVRVIAYRDNLTATFLVHPDNFWETTFWVLESGCSNDLLLKKDIPAAKQAFLKSCRLAGVKLKQ